MSEFSYQIDKVDNNLYFIGEINIESINELTQFIHKLEKDNNIFSANLYLSSHGGAVFDGLKLYDVLRLTRLNFTIYITSWVNSAASYCLFTKHKIVMYQNATIGFHEMSYNFNDKHSNNLSAVKCSEKLMEKILKIYNTKTPEITRDWLLVDKYLDAKEALDLKIIDEII